MFERLLNFVILKMKVVLCSRDSVVNPRTESFPLDTIMYSLVSLLGELDHWVDDS